MQSELRKFPKEFWYLGPGCLETRAVVLLEVVLVLSLFQVK